MTKNKVPLNEFINAVNLDNTSKALQILSSGLDPNTFTKKRLSLLHYSSWNGMVEVTNALIVAGANVNVRESLAGKTALFNATNYKIVSYLLKAGADVNVQDEHDHNTMLHNDSLSYLKCKLILEHGFNTNLTNRMGWNVLHMQTAYDNPSCVDLLLDHGMRVDIKNANGKTALDIANIFELDKCKVTLERHLLASSIKNNKHENVDAGIGL